MAFKQGNKQGRRFKPGESGNKAGRPKDVLNNGQLNIIIQQALMDVFGGESAHEALRRAFADRIRQHHLLDVLNLFVKTLPKQAPVDEWAMTKEIVIEWPDAGTGEKKRIELQGGTLAEALGAPCANKGK